MMAKPCAQVGSNTDVIKLSTAVERIHAVPMADILTNDLLVSLECFARNVFEVLANKRCASRHKRLFRLGRDEVISRRVRRQCAVSPPLTRGTFSVAAPLLLSRREDVRQFIQRAVAKTFGKQLSPRQGRVRVLQGPLVQHADGGFVLNVAG